ncbi:hypothetical protein FJZ31_22025 [Candidatus Poribacteria bacterium]|nr:hypothetical protein [Candidatus Poribacteria bacterium]
MAEIGTGKPSPVAMLLSVIWPGLGQLYLRKIRKAVVLFLLAAIAAFIIYANSWPIHNFSDLWRLDVKESYPIWQFKDKQLMFRPLWQFKASGYIQFIATWLYGVVDGWMGRRIYKRRKDELAKGQNG